MIMAQTPPHARNIPKRCKHGPWLTQWRKLISAASDCLSHGGGGIPCYGIQRYFRKQPPGERGGTKFFPCTYIQNFHEMWMFLAECSVYCIESKHDK